MKMSRQRSLSSRFGTFVLLIGAACSDRPPREEETTGKADVKFNFCPVLSTYTVVPSKVPKKGTASVSASVSDPEREKISYSWSARSGRFLTRKLPDTLYTCDATGTQTLTLTATDSGGCESQFEVRVECLE